MFEGENISKEEKYHRKSLERIKIATDVGHAQLRIELETRSIPNFSKFSLCYIGTES